MRAQRGIATVMILAGSVVTAWASRDIAFPAILGMLGLLGLRRRFTWDFQPERRFITSLLLLLLAVLFALHYQYAGALRWGGNEQAAIVAWQTIARYFFASMILILFLGPPDRLPPSLGLFHVATVVSAGQVLLLDDLYLAFRFAELLCVALVILYAATAREGTQVALSWRAGQRSRWVTSGLILLLAGNFGWVMSSTLYRHLEVLNYLPLWLWRGAAAVEAATGDVASVGFSKSGRLSSLLLIKEDPDTSPVLNIVSETNPGYLRACTFEVYRQSQWHDLSYRDAVFPAQSTPLGAYLVGRMNLFRLSQAEPDETLNMAIRHESPITDVMFTPLGTLSVEAPLNLVMHDDDDVVYPPNTRGRLSYRLSATESPYGRPPGGQHGHQMLNIPAELDPRIRELARTIFAGRDTTAEKIDAVVTYFQTNYTYSLGLDIPPGVDKLTHFLLEESTGYCEYFASGAAILLRLAGVPTRYVTGFLVTEKGANDESWIARNMDAHAWVEAWDQQRNRWTIVEATAQEGLGTAAMDDDSGGAGQGSRSFLIGRLLDNLYEYGLFGVLAWLFEFYGLVGLSFVIATPLAGTAWWIYRKRSSKQRRRSQMAESPELAILHKILARMDRRVAACGPRRALSETLQAFASRLRRHDAGDGRWAQVSDWYLEYAGLRYGRALDPGRVVRLHQRAQDLRDAL